jgi:hypothetical protein
MKHQIHPLRLLAAFLALGTAALVVHGSSASWWLVPLGAFGPDLSFLAAIGGPSNVGGNMPTRVVRPYNLAHHPVGPLALLALGCACNSPSLIVVALSWGSHLLWDRGVGYGLRRSDGTIIETRSRRGAFHPNHAEIVAARKTR